MGRGHAIGRRSMGFTLVLAASFIPDRTSPRPGPTRVYLSILEFYGSGENRVAGNLQIRELYPTDFEREVFSVPHVDIGARLRENWVPEEFALVAQADRAAVS